MNKRGAQGVIVISVVTLLAIFVAAVVIVAISQPGDVVSAVDTVTNFIMKVIYPLFNKTLKFDGGDFDFLRFLAFILLVIVVVTTLDSINMFGDEGSSSGKWINFFIGLIIGIIGVRYMPADVWSSLTAPSSALIATLLVGLPFLAMFFITMKMKYPIIRKFIWLFYVIFLVYLIIRAEVSGGIKAVYFTFAGLSIAMMLLDARIRNFFRAEITGRAVAGKILTKAQVKQRNVLLKELKGWQEIADNIDETAEDRTLARGEVVKIKKELRQTYQEDLI